MPVADAISAIALGVLAVAGVAKIVRPDPTRGALQAARLPSSRLTVRALGLAEVSSAALGLSLGRRWVTGALVIYLGLTVFTSMALRKQIPVQSCGCFGIEDTPPTRIHLVFNAVAFLSLAVVSLSGRTPLPLAPETVVLGAYLGFTAVGCYLSLLLLTRLPQTQTAIGDR